MNKIGVKEMTIFILFKINYIYCNMYVRIIHDNIIIIVNKKILLLPFHTSLHISYVRYRTYIKNERNYRKEFKT